MYNAFSLYYNNFMEKSRRTYAQFIINVNNKNKVLFIQYLNYSLEFSLNNYLHE